jgi:hypothetical protein
MQEVLVTDPAADRSPEPERLTDARHLIGSFIGMIGMACALFLVLASGLVAPAWAVVVLTLVWLVLFVLGTRWFMHHPWRVAALPVVMLAVWVGGVSAGAAFLDWTA